jgi:hypothetical protein
MYLYLPIVFFIIVNIVQHRRRRIINKFYDADALTPSTAKTFTEVGVADGIVAKLMLNRGVLRSTEEGRYFISLSRIEELDRNSLTRLKYIAGAAGLFLIAAGIYWLLR